MRKCVTKSYDNSIAPFRPGHLKFRFSEKATKITKKSPIVLTLLSKSQKNWEFFSNFVAFSQCLNLKGSFF